MKNKHKVEDHIQWKIKSGSCLFWWDNWLGIGLLGHFTGESNRFNEDTVADFMEHGQWNITKLIQLAPQDQVHNILATHLQLQPGILDQLVWNLNTNGDLTFTSAWNTIREQRPKTTINTYSCHRSIPLKCSFLLCREIRGKLPTNEQTGRFRSEPSECFCCTLQPKTPSSIPLILEKLPALSRILLQYL